MIVYINLLQVYKTYSNTSKKEKLLEVEQNIKNIEAKIQKLEKNNKQLLEDNDELHKLYEEQDNLLGKI